MAASSDGHRRWRHGMWCASFFFSFFHLAWLQKLQKPARFSCSQSFDCNADCPPTCHMRRHLHSHTHTQSHSHTHTRYAPTFVAGTLTQFLCSGRCAALAAPPFVHPCPAPPCPCGSMLEFCRLVFLSLGDAAAKCQEVNT